MAKSFWVVKDVGRTGGPENREISPLLLLLLPFSSGRIEFMRLLLFFLHPDFCLEMERERDKPHDSGEGAKCTGKYRVAEKAVFSR